ncbi:disease resistance protein Pik-2-like [Typha latifolia]|uniref:disease resistance protein Pik-2-like n=1 Tax=Typha latifolia TaxID=4733 RepID=UPI003C2C176C
MNALLSLPSEMLDPDDIQINIWVSQVRDLAYDAEDCIDEFMQHFGEPQGQCFTGCLGRGIHRLRTLKSRHQIATEIQDLKIRAREIAERRSKYAVTSSSGGSYAKRDPRLPSLFVDQSKLVGIGGSMHELAEWFTKNNQLERGVVAIVGPGGMGKTTLAMTVYHSPILTSIVLGSQSLGLMRQRFQWRASVTVSQDFDVDNVLGNILRQVIQVDREHRATSGAERVQEEKYLEGREKWGTERLVSMLREQLQDKRYVIVLDDIWTVSAWESIKISLPENLCGSRIIVTTRIETVANYICSHAYDHIYRIQPLSEVESKELLFKRVFGHGSNYLPELELVSNAILKKCGGLPLAIVNVGGLLASNRYRTPLEWQRVLDSLGYELETSPTLEGMKQILTLSYNDLPSHLKNCFLYLSIFPGNYKIRRSILARRWVAEGIVGEVCGMSIEDVAESYFDQLVSRNVVQPVDIDIDGKVTACQVHDIMLEVIVSKAVEENFVSLVSDQRAASPHKTVRRLSVDSRVNREDGLASMNLSHVRSLTVFNYAEQLVASHFKLLRLLDVEGCKDLDDYHLMYICKMLQLKYLSIRNTEVSCLPEEIGELQYLETLDIRETNITSLPRGIVKLRHLKHLLAGRTYRALEGADKYLFRQPVQMPRRFRKMNNLQTLPPVEVSKSSAVLQELPYLYQLRKLVIYYRNEEDSAAPLRQTLEKLRRLRSLSLWSYQTSECRPIDISFLDGLSFSSGDLQNLQLCGYLFHLPSWVTSLSYVTKLTLCWTKLDSIGVLKELPSLLCLRLYYWSCYCDPLSLGCSGFARLKMLVINDELITKVEFGRGAARNLEKIKWVFLGRTMEDTYGIEGIAFLPNLKEIELGGIVGNYMHRVAVDAESHPNHPRVTVRGW